MRILVMSDAHGAVAPVVEAIEAQPDARHIIYLGDGERQLDFLPEQYPEREFTFVRGNNDFGSVSPEECLLELGGMRIFAVHGHQYGVGAGVESLFQAARRLGAQIVLSGHTHVAKTEYRDGITLLNPGSIARPRAGGASYGVLDITPAGVVAFHVPARR